MVFSLRESTDIRNIKSLEGKDYRIQKTAYGFGEQVTFFDENGREIESFTPTSSYEYMDGIYELEDEEKVIVEGMKIRTEFSFSQWYE